MKDILADSSNFRRRNPLRKHLNKKLEIRTVIKELHQEDKLNNKVFKVMASWFSPWNYVWSSHGLLYYSSRVGHGLPKVHKATVDNFLKFRPILSAIRTPTYTLAKYLVPFFGIRPRQTRMSNIVSNIIIVFEDV